MAKNLKYSELARALGISNASVTMAIKNGTLIKNKNEKTINIDATINKLWIEHQIIKGRTFDINRIYIKKPIIKDISLKKEVIQKTKTKTKTESKIKNKKKSNTVEELKILEEDGEGILVRIRKVELKQKEATLKKTGKDILLAELKIQKQQGQLIPFDAAKSVFLYAIESMRNIYLQETRGVANIFVQITGADHNKFIQLQKDLSEKIEDIQKSVKDELIINLDKIVEEYKEVRGRGESK